MIRDLEERLFAAADQTVEVPDADHFLDRLHQTLNRRKRVRRTVTVAVTTAAVILITSVGLLLNLTEPGRQDYLVYDEFGLFSDIGETGTVDVDWVDRSLVLEALNYLIQEADFVENGWKTVETLEELGFIDFEQQPNSEG